MGQLVNDLLDELEYSEDIINEETIACDNLKFKINTCNKLLNIFHVNIHSVRKKIKEQLRLKHINCIIVI